MKRRKWTKEEENKLKQLYKEEINEEKGEVKW